MIGEGIRRVWDQGPDKQFARHSEGDFLRLRDGCILFAYTRFFESNSDQGASSIVAIRAADEGETWSSPQEVINAGQFGLKNVMSVSLQRMQNGDVGLFYILKESWYTHIMLARSKDEGKTFYKNEECTLSDRPGWFVLNNSRVERLKSGRLLLPLAYHRTGQDPKSGKIFFDPCSSFCLLYSDDDGQTWQEGPDVVHPPFTGTRTGLQEPGIIELEDDVLWAYFRTDKMFQYESFSRDGGLHWTVPQPSRFTSPVSPMKIVREPDSGYLLAVWNPVPNYQGRSEMVEGAWTGGRTPIVYAESKDDGRKWSEYQVIEADDRHGYCYPAIFFTDDSSVLMAYCAGGVEDDICLARLTMVKMVVKR